MLVSPSIQRPRPTIRPHTTEATSSQNSARSQRFFILVIAVMFVANQVALLIVRWR
jgi:hypothetical protein